MAGELRADATLRDVAGSLDHPEEFVRRVLEVMWAERQREGLAMRLGVMGTGRRPNYRLEQGGTPFVALDGNSHKPWPAGETFAGADNWSTGTMTVEEVRQLLGEMRKGGGRL